MGWWVGGLLSLLLVASINVGIFVQPFAPYWFGQQSTLTVPVGNPVVLPTPRAAAVPAPAIPRLMDVVDVAKTWLGTPYLWGGCSRRGVDCSCFMQSIFREVGITTMPRVTVDQIHWAIPISRAEATAGDLVFFDNTCTGCGANPTHVGLYLGGRQMIDAGDPVRIEPVYTDRNARYGRVHL
jgi:cell wall-associated NlpC family hydrolase